MTTYKKPAPPTVNEKNPYRGKKEKPAGTGKRIGKSRVEKSNNQLNRRIK